MNILLVEGSQTTSAWVSNPDMATATMAFDHAHLAYGLWFVTGHGKQTRWLCPYATLGPYTGSDIGYTDQRRLGKK